VSNIEEMQVVLRQCLEKRG